MACPVKIDVVGNRRLVEQNNHMRFEQKEVRNEVLGEGKGLGSSEEDESRVNAVAENMNVVPGGEIQVHSELQLIPQQLPQGSTVCWERFLPVRSLKVLLVENDDSTRHVVSALLRNCSYEVTAVSNGFHAWKILEDLSNHIDIIITEVAMPFISGIALLCKIRSHKTFKNIPVVMMSSHDSMGIVFKCLSNGAVDFLVKPIRKNELKNLWQHVWRRCHSSSGSGSESGTQSRKSVKLRNAEESDNHTASSDEQDDRSNGPNIRDGSDDDSGTQSSWTKRAAEVESPGPDSTCAQVIHMKPEAIVNQHVHATETKECQEHAQQLDLDTRVSSNSKLKLSAQPTIKRQNVSPEVDSKPFDRLTEQNNELLTGKLRALDHNGSCAIAGLTDPQIESRTFDGPSGLSNISKLKNEVKHDSGQLSSLEVRLRRLRGVEDTGNTEHDDHTVLRRSDLSAFSKYDTASSSNQGPTGNVGSCSPLDNSPVALKTEIMQNFPSQSNSNPPIQQSNGSSNNNDMASTTYVNLKHEALNEKSEFVSAFKCFDSSALPPMQSSHTCPPGKEDDVRVDTSHAQQPKGSQHQVQVQHHHHYYHHFHHHVKDTDQHQQDRDDETSLKDMAVTAPQCGSSNALGGPINGNAGNVSMNRSGSGSNHGSNGQNGDSTALNIESNNGAAGNSGDGGGTSGRIGEDAGDEDRVSQREAVMYKFRQKRKERSSEKKCHSRKKPAGQQHHIGGQTVPPIVSNSNSSKDNKSNDHVPKANSDDSIR